MIALWNLQKILVKNLLTQRRAPLSDTVKIDLCVLPPDLDLNMHMNNSRYLKAMDYGRFAFILRTGVLRVCAKRRWRAVAGAIDIQFRRSLQPFDRYVLKTKLDFWDEKWWVMEQSFEVSGKVYARARVRMLFLDKRGQPVPTQKIFQEMAWDPGLVTKVRQDWRTD